MTTNPIDIIENHASKSSFTSIVIDGVGTKRHASAATSSVDGSNHAELAIQLSFADLPAPPRDLVSTTHDH
jgi:hypothetical protein